MAALVAVGYEDSLVRVLVAGMRAVSGTAVTANQALDHADRWGLPKTRTRPAAATGDVADDELCVICIDGAATLAMIPCGHLCLCVDCRERESIAQCPVCRTQGKPVRIFKG